MGIYPSIAHSIVEKSTSIDSFGVFQLKAFIEKIMAPSAHNVAQEKRFFKMKLFNSFFFSINFFLLAITSYLSLRSLNLRVTLPFLFMRRHACKSVFYFYTSYRQGLAYLLLKVLIGNWSRNLAKFDYFPSNVLCCTKFIFSNSITGLWRRLLQFFENCSSEWSSLYLPKESSNRLFRCANFSLYSQLLFRLTRLLKDLVTTIL